MQVVKWLIGGVMAVAVVSAPHAQDDSALREAEQRGKALLELDRVAQAALVKAEDSRAFRRDDRVAGWVWEQRGSTYVITFVGLDSDDGVVERFRISMSSSAQALGEVDRLDRQPVSSRLAAQFFARQRATGTEHSKCSTTYESLVMPGNDGGWHVYLMPRSAFPDVHLMGGTFRMDVSERGDAVGQVLSLAADCSLLQDSPDMPALQVADAVAGQPNELHVYLGQVLNKPLYVRTTLNQRTWLIQNGQILEVAPTE